MKLLSWTWLSWVEAHSWQTTAGLKEVDIDAVRTSAIPPSQSPSQTSSPVVSFLTTTIPVPIHNTSDNPSPLTARDRDRRSMVYRAMAYGPVGLTLCNTCNEQTFILPLLPESTSSFQIGAQRSRWSKTRIRGEVAKWFHPVSIHLDQDQRKCW